MKDGKASMSRRTKLVFAVVAVAIMIVAVFPLFSNTSSADDPPGYQRAISYYYNSTLSGEPRVITYDGIASTEYNPEFWEGTGHVPASFDVYMRQVNPVSGDLVKDEDGNLIYDLVPAGTDIGNLAIFVNDNGTMVPFDPFIHGSSNNWVGPSVDVQNITITGVTVDTGNNMGPTDLMITGIDGFDSNVSISNGKITNIGSPQTGAITVTLKTNKVFGGWISAGAGNHKYLPGDVILPNTAEYNDDVLYANWITPDVYYKNGEGTISSGSCTVYCKPYILAPVGDPFSKTGYSWKYGDGRSADSMYGTIRMFADIGGQYTLNGQSLNTGTYRSLDPSEKAYWKITNNAVLQGDAIVDCIKINTDVGGKHQGTKGSILASGHVLIVGVGIDNPALNPTVDVSSDKTSGALSVYGGKSGGNITANISSDNMQFFGANEDKRRLVFRDKYNNSYTEDYDVTTCVIVHSGTYKVLAGGSCSGSIGKNKDPENGHFSTYMVIRGGTCGDAVFGGSTGQNSGVFGDTRSRTGTITDTRYGGTFTYLLGHFFSSGDNWQDKMTGNLYKIAGRDNYLVLENTVVSGSCHQFDQTGTAHLFISDNASVWVTNAGNREEKGYTSVGMLDISGSAVVRHIAAGATANASNDDKYINCVKGVWLSVRDNATVALALGGGYDIYSPPNKNTIMEGSVNVTVSGGTVGNIYGGGYRGSIGTTNDPSNLTVNVTVSGGTVLGNVYGGGSGGTDRGQHDQYGSYARSTNTTMSEGRSYVYGNVNVSVTGGTVNGNVYGGGMSVPVLSSYLYDKYDTPNTSEKNYARDHIGGIYIKVGEDKYRSPTRDQIYSGEQLYRSMNGTSYEEVTLSDEDKAKILYYVVTGENYYAATYEQLHPVQNSLKIIRRVSTPNVGTEPISGNYVAAVYGSTNVTVSGGEILGSVYGGGEGISMTKDSTNDCIITKDYSRTPVIKTFGSQPTFDTIPWYANGEPTYYTEDLYSTYLKYAKVGEYANPVKYSNTRVNITDGENTTAHISGGVFGGGCSGLVEGSRTVGVDCKSVAEGKEYNVDNSVYGGSSSGNDTGDSIVAITNGKIRNSVFGGGFMGTTNGNTSVCIGYEINNEGVVDHVEGTTIYIGDSVYAGADVKPGSGIPYSQALVLKNGTVYVYGRNSNITIKGSIMGDGNSCLTKGWKEIQIEYFISNQTLTGIHRANKVSISTSNIKISGREARIFDKVQMYDLYYKTGVDSYTKITNASQISSNLDSLYYVTSEGSQDYIQFSIDDDTFYKWNESGYDCNESAAEKTDYTMLDKSNLNNLYSNMYANAASHHLYIGDTTGSNQLIKMASLFRIGKLSLQNGSYIAIDKPAEDIRAYESLDTRGNPTSDIAPMNQIEFTTGGSFYVRKEMSADISDYGSVTGFTQLVISNQGSYGAYVFGRQTSTGGFVVSKDGQYVYANISDFTGNVRAWFVAGTEHKIITMSLPTTGIESDLNTVTSTIDLTVLQDGSNLRYMGGEYIPSHSGFTFDPTSSPGAGNYSLSFAYPDSLAIKGKFHIAGGVLKVTDEEYNEYFALYHEGNLYINVTSENFDPTRTMYAGYAYDTKEPVLFAKKDGDIYSINTEVEWEDIENNPNKYYALLIDSKYIINGENINNGAFFDDGTTPATYKTLYKYGPSNGLYGNGVYTLNVKFVGKSTQSTDYLGFVILDFEEFELVKCNNVGDPVPIVVNTVEIRIDLYVDGYDDGQDIVYDLNLDAVYDNSGYSVGSADILVQQPHNNYSVYVNEMTAYVYATSDDLDANEITKYVRSGSVFVEATNGDLQDNGITKYVLANNVPDIVISGVGNVNNTNGWLEAYNRTLQPGSGLNSKIGVLSGGYHATVRLSINSLATPEGLSYVIVSEIRDTGNQHVSTITINLSINWRGYVTVTFHDENREGGGTAVKQFRYNYVMTPSDCPPTTSNFSGWYYKENGNFTKIYNFNSQLTEDIDLYARHMITVTFDYNYGITSTILLNEEVGGTLIPIPAVNPVRNGYEFNGWYETPECTGNPWNPSTKITLDKTLYAGWTGKAVTLEFYNGGVDPVYTESNFVYGDALGGLTSTAAEGISFFQYWKYGETPVYDNTVIDENFITWVDSLTIRFDAYATVPTDTTLHIRTLNDDSEQGYEGPDDEDVTVQRHGVDYGYIADMYLSADDSYVGYAEATGGDINPNWDTASTILGIVAVHDSDKRGLISVQGTYVIPDGIESIVLSTNKINGEMRLRIGSNGAYYYDGGNYVVVNKTVFDAHINSDLLVNLYQNIDGVQTKVTLFKEDCNIYEYSFTNGATSPGYNFLGWHYGNNDAVSASHGLIVCFKSDKVRWVLDTSYTDAPIWTGETTFANLTLDFKASWQQMNYTVKTSNNANGYITVWLKELFVVNPDYDPEDPESEQYIEATLAQIADEHVTKYYESGGGHTEATGAYLVPLGNQFTAHYNDEVYIRFDGDNGYTFFQQWLTIGGCLITPIGLPEDGRATMKITGDCGFTATMTINEQIVTLTLTYKDGNTTRHLTSPLNVSLYHNGEYIELAPHEGPDSYIGYAGDGEYGVCIYANGSYYLVGSVSIGNNRDVRVDNIELIYITNEQILPIDNLYTIDIETQTYQDIDDTISLNYEEGDRAAYLYIIGGMNYTPSKISGENLTIDPITRQIIFDENISSKTKITLVGCSYYIDEHTTKEISKIIIVNMEQQRIYIIGKSGVVVQDGNWQEWAVGYEIYDGEGNVITLRDHHISSITWSLHDLDTSVPGIVLNIITVNWEDDSYASEYRVYIVNGAAIVYRAESSTVTVEIITPINNPVPQQGIQQLNAPNPLSVEQVSQMAKAESANDILAVIGHSFGRRA